MSVGRKDYNNMPIFFISDLHLSSARPKTSELFVRFLETEAKQAEALYILGDFFEAWVGMAGADRHDSEIMAALKSFAQTACPVYFMRGNRDFLLNDEFAQKSHCTLLPDPFVLTLYGKRVVLTHGDQLCTLDKPYQRFRRFVRHPITQRFFLSLPIQIRKKIATFIRKSGAQKRLRHQYASQLGDPVDQPHFDVVFEDVCHLLREQKASILIHGHTHKPMIHHFSLDGAPVQRIVLGDWNATGSVLVYGEDKIELKVVDR